MFLYYQILNLMNYLTSNEGILTKRSNCVWDVSRIEKNID